MGTVMNPRLLHLVSITVAASASALPFPNPDWPLGKPEDHGMSSEKLAAVARYAKDAKSTSNIHSATKSVTSALIGIAQDLGLLNINSAYGYLWWLGHTGHWVLPMLQGEGNGSLFPAGLETAYAMMGANSQVAVVDPHRHMLVVRQGEATDTGDRQFVGRLLQMVLDAYV